MIETVTPKTVNKGEKPEMVENIIEKLVLNKEDWLELLAMFFEDVKSSAYFALLSKNITEILKWIKKEFEEKEFNDIQSLIRKMVDVALKRIEEEEKAAEVQNILGKIQKKEVVS